MFYLIAVLVIITVLIIGIVVFFKFFYTTVPQSTALIVDEQKVYFANTITSPMSKKQLMLIEPVLIKTVYMDNSGLLCKEKLLLNITISYSLCVEFNEASVLKAATKIGVENVSDPTAVLEGLSESLASNLKSLVAQYSYDVLDKDRGKVRKALFQQLNNQLYGYKVEYINIEQIDLVSLEELSKQKDQQLFIQQQQARHEWGLSQKQQLEHRLKLITDHQQDLSNKIKAMIENYQKVIRQKIKFFINRELLK